MDTEVEAVNAFLCSTLTTIWTFSFSLFPKKLKTKSSVQGVLLWALCFGLWQSFVLCVACLAVCVSLSLSLLYVAVFVFKDWGVWDFVQCSAEVWSKNPAFWRLGWSESWRLRRSSELASMENPTTTLAICRNSDSTRLVRYCIRSCLSSFWGYNLFLICIRYGCVSMLLLNSCVLWLFKSILLFFLYILLLLLVLFCGMLNAWIEMNDWIYVWNKKVSDL